MLDPRWVIQGSGKHPRARRWDCPGPGDRHRISESQVFRLPKSRH